MVDGVEAAGQMFDRLPDAAREQLGVELVILGREGLAAQKAMVAAQAYDTGRLEGGLSIQLLVDQLKVRIGLIGVKRGRASLFYGRIVNFGRKAQTVIVQRRRRVDGKLRVARGRKMAADIAATYRLKVKARPAIPFIDAPGKSFEADAAAQLAEYWSRVFARAGV